MVQECDPALPLHGAVFAITAGGGNNLLDISGAKHIERPFAVSRRILACEKRQLRPGVVLLSRAEDPVQMWQSASFRELPCRIAETSPPERDANKPSSLSPLLYRLAAYG